MSDRDRQNALKEALRQDQRLEAEGVASVAWSLAGPDHADTAEIVEDIINSTGRKLFNGGCGAAVLHGETGFDERPSEFTSTIVLVSRSHGDAYAQNLISACQGPQIPDTSSHV